jgi:hypothetical protein
MPQPDPTESELLDMIQTLAKGRLSPARKRELDQITAELEWHRCVRDPYYFLTSLALTKDEHALAKGEESPYKPFPRRLVHVEAITRWWQRGQAGGPERIGMTPKSRQMSASWVAMCLYLWKCMTKQATRVSVQTKKEDDADQMLERPYGVWSRLPKYVRDRNPCEKKFCKMRFPASDSSMHGLAQGANQARQYTFTDFFADEMAFQEQTEATFTAIQPTIDRYGSFWGVSSAGPGFFAEACTADELPGTHKVLVPSWHEKKGVTTWENHMGFSVLQIHYSSHPDKDEAWAARESKRYPGGREGKYWRGEQEIDFGAKQGRLVYPEFDRDVHVISLRKDQVPPEWPLFRVIDPGYVNPCGVLFIAIDGDGCLYVIDEFYESGQKVPEVASKIKALTGRRRAEFTLIGHDAFRETQSAGKTLADQFLDEGISCSPVDTRIDAGVLVVAKLLMVDDRGEPKLKILDRCTNTIKEMEGYRYPELGEDEKDKKAEKEKPLPVNDHLMDCLRYAAMGIPPNFMKQNLMRDPHEVRDMLVDHKRAARAKVMQGRMHVTEDDDGELWDE